MRIGRFLAASGLLALMVSSAAPQQPQPPLPVHPSTSGRLLVAVMYSRGPKWIEDKNFIEQPMAPHAQYMHALVAQNRLMLGGPYRDNLGELTILEVSDFPDAKAIVANDPAIQTGILKAELHPWQISFDGQKDKHARRQAVALSEWGLIRLDEVLIRQAGSADVPHIETLLRSAAMVSHAVLSPDSIWWVAERAGEIVGVAGMEIGGAAVLMRSVLVRADMRGMQLGAILTDALFMRARQLGFARVYLFSTDAGSYWMKLGFHEVPVDELVAALPGAPEVIHFGHIGWLPTEIAYLREV